MNEPNSRRRFLRDLTGAIARIGSGGLVAAVAVAAPAEAGKAAPACAVDAGGASRTDPGASVELLADMNDLAGILEQ